MGKTRFKKIWGLTSKDIGIDLGTANIIVTLKGKGIVLKDGVSGTTWDVDL